MVSRRCSRLTQCRALTCVAFSFKNDTVTLYYGATVLFFNNTVKDRHLTVDENAYNNSSNKRHWQNDKSKRFFTISEQYINESH